MAQGTPGRNTVLVTGARGFIGHAVAKLLQREAYGVIALDLAPAAVAGNPRRVGLLAVHREVWVQGGADF